MRVRAFAVCAVPTLLLAWPAAAQQQRTPSAVQFAVGGDVGFFVARPGYNDTITVDGLGELYFLSRLSLRGLFGWENPGVSGSGCISLPTACGRVNYDHLRLEFSGVWNWEGGDWHPFVLAGVGGTWVKDAVAGEFARRGEFTPHFGGGIEYFVRPNITIKGEVTYHWIRHSDLVPDPSGLTVTAGLKRYL